jgi:hypothetical protein
MVSTARIPSDVLDNTEIENQYVSTRCIDFSKVTFATSISKRISKTYSGFISTDSDVGKEMTTARWERGHMESSIFIDRKTYEIKKGTKFLVPHRSMTNISPLWAQDPDGVADARIDIGADMSCIPLDYASQLGPMPFGQISINPRIPVASRHRYSASKRETIEQQDVIIDKSYQRKESLRQAIEYFKEFKSFLNKPEAAMYIHRAKEKLEESWNFIAHEDREIGMMISAIEDSIRQLKWHDYKPYQVEIIRDILQDCVDGKIKSQKDVLDRTSKLFKHDIDIFPSAPDEAYEEND